MLDPLLLHHKIQEKVSTWRSATYPHPTYPAIGEILRWAAAPDGSFQLRPPQLMALECYWYLRLVMHTAHVADLYTQLFPAENEWAQALSLPPETWQAGGASRERFLSMLREDERFVREHRLESLLETMTLAYPSYILALAMGVGKTVLIGALIASEFALAMTYPTGPFLRNALVFAPGRTIVEALRELIALPYAAFLPPHMYLSYAASIKFIVPQDGERSLPVLPGSAYNVIITNTEKIRIQKEKVRKAQIGLAYGIDQLDAAKAEVANLRLQTIASLPNLGIFSDEAHHTYGRALNNGLKKVRQTVDYIAAQTTVHVVVNTTGTPYFGRQPLYDVIAAYGLAAGIRDGILKEVGENVIVYARAKEHKRLAAEAAPLKSVAEAHQLTPLLRDIVTDFFAQYETVALADGTPAKLAIYFPKTADIAATRPLLERFLIELGHAPTLLLEHHTHCDNKADFDRFHTPQSPHRIALLVDRGVEGWDVPALFACALVRKLKTSNNFVLQAASRCLRQVAGNQIPARIYLSAENEKILTRQLQATYGVTLRDVVAARQLARPDTPAPAPEKVAERRRLPQPRWQPPAQLHLVPPAPSTATSPSTIYRRQMAFGASTTEGDRAPTSTTEGDRAPTSTTEGDRAPTSTTKGDRAPTSTTEGDRAPTLAAAIGNEPFQQGDTVLQPLAPALSLISHYAAAVELAANYHLPSLLVYRALRAGYPQGGLLPVGDLPLLQQQIEQQCHRPSEASRD